MGCQRAVDVDDVGAVEAIGAEMVFDVAEVVAVRQDFVAVTGVLCGPGTRTILVALLKLQRIDFPCLPDLFGEVLALLKCGERVVAAVGGASVPALTGQWRLEAPGVEEEEEDNDADDVQRETALDLSRDGDGFHLQVNQAELIDGSLHLVFGIHDGQSGRIDATLVISVLPIGAGEPGGLDTRGSANQREMRTADLF